MLYVKDRQKIRYPYIRSRDIVSTFDCMVISVWLCEIFGIVCRLGKNSFPLNICLMNHCVSLCRHYSKDPGDIVNNYVHLTNVAIQKTADNYNAEVRSFISVM